MSQQIENITVSSPTPKLMYSRDFLIKFRGCVKVEPEIQNIVTPILSPDTTRKTSNVKVTDGTPKRRLNFENSPKHSPLPKGSRTPKPILKPIALPQQSKSAQKERPSKLSTFNSTKWTKGNEIPSIQVNTPSPLSKSKIDKRNPLTQISANVANNIQQQPTRTVTTPSKFTPSKNPTKIISSQKNAVASPKPVGELPSFVIPEETQFVTPSENTLQGLNTPVQSPFKPSPPKVTTSTEVLAPPRASLLPRKSVSENQLAKLTPKDRSTYLTPQVTKAPSLVTPVVRGATPTRKLPSPLDEHRVSQRMKQIEYGYKTVGYLRYRLLVPKDHRASDHPRTPRKEQGCSKRSWDGQLKKWRRELHRWDPEDIAAFEALLDSDIVKSIIARSKDLVIIIDDVKQKMREDPKNLLKDEYDMDTTENETPGDINSQPITTECSVEEIPTITQQVNQQQAVDVDISVNTPEVNSEPIAFDKVARTLVF